MPRKKKKVQIRDVKEERKKREEQKTKHGRENARKSYVDSPAGGVKRGRDNGKPHSATKENRTPSDIRKQIG